MKEFKAGDKVYFPTLDSKVHLLVETTAVDYKLGLQFTGNTFTLKGQQRYRSEHVPAIFHATEENKELLNKLYGVEFEAAPPKTRTVIFERPETFIPSFGEGYWFILASVSGGVEFRTNVGSRIDEFSINNGVWRTEEEAIMVANAIFNIEKDS